MAVLLVGILVSACSSYGRFWEAPQAIISCPTNFLRIPMNTAVGVSQDFCIAKFEMKCASDSSGVACSGPALAQAANKPWAVLSQSTAKNVCGNLGSTYHLMTNAEAMSIARDIESTASNWSGGIVNSGKLNTGHSDNAPALSLAASTDADACSGTGNSCSADTWHLQKRTLTLSTGESIWDFAGNVTEWIDWQVTASQKAYAASDGSPVVGWREWTDINTNTGPESSMPARTWQSAASSLSSIDGIGMYFSGAANPAAANRGGAWNDTSAAGIYSLNLHETPNSQYLTVGFRCAHVP